jgi:hypothetical protein
MQNQISRVRICLVLTSFGLVAAAVGCGETNNPVRPTALSGTGAVEAIATSRGSESTTDAVGPDLAAVRRATAQFHDISAAYAAGYTTENEPCVASPDGVMGVHAPNLSLIGDPALDPTRPELLLYVPKPNGKYTLVGVEYFQVVLVRNRLTNEVGPWFSPDPWPAQYEVLTPTPKLFGQTFQGPMPGHTPTMPWHWDLHAWIWAHNPSGMFAEWNPSLSCQ